MTTPGTPPASTYGDALSSAQDWAWIWEQDAARQLLAHGIHTLQASQFTEVVRDPILTTLSIGVEKLLKLTLGQWELAQGRNWPTRSFMQSTYRHNIATMDDAVRQHMRDWLPTAGAGGYLASVLERVDRDPVWPELREALDGYGRQGRFHFLDLLADGVASSESPVTALARVEYAVGPSADVSAAIADSVANWWFAIARFSIHGFLGDRGKTFGWEVEPSHALPPVDIEPL